MFFGGSLPTFRRTAVFLSSLGEKTKQNCDVLLCHLPFNDEDMTATEPFFLVSVCIGSGADPVVCRKKSFLLDVRQ